MNILIGICTYNRNHLLKALLHELKKQTLSHKENTVDIAVCDNSHESNAKHICKDIKYYVTETNNGIVNARNTLLALAIDKKYEALLFLDDDECINSGFIEGYISAYIANKKPDYIASSVTPTLAKDLHHYPWLKHTHFYTAIKRSKQWIKMPTIIGTGNVLIRIEFIVKHHIRFNKKFNKTGGEDALFFFEMQKHGAKGLWLPELDVTEHLSDDRYSYAYFKRRCMTLPCAGVRAYQASFGTLKTYQKWLPKAFAHLMLSVVFIVISFISRNYTYKAQQHYYTALGQISGMLNRHITIYGDSKK